MDYVYQSLPGLGWIRLLQTIWDTLPSGKPRLQAQLVVRRLEDVLGQYEALSYYWGDPNPIHRLFLSSGDRLPITQAFASAFPMLARKTTTNFLWIDQICINQSDLEEKTLQVGQMGKIYAGAKTVLVWLDRDTENSGHLVKDMVEAIGSDPDAPRFLGYHDLEATRKLEPLLEMGKKSKNGAPTQGELRRKAVTSMLRCPWWKRAWVCQEVALARAIKVLWCSLTFEWRDIDRLAQAVLRIESKHDGGGTRDTIIEKAPCWGAMETMMQRHWEVQSKGHIWRFLGLMSQVGAQFSSTDPRDMIFAFAGLPNNDGVHFTPDYSQTVAEVYMGATRAFIDAEGRLDVLALTGGDRSSEREELPSWCPDWSIRRFVGMPICDLTQSTGFRASRDRLHVKSRCFSHERLSLYTRGKIIDSILYVHHDHAFETRYFMDDLHAFLDIEGCYQALKNHTAPEDNTLTRSRVLRATIADGRRPYIDRRPGEYASDAEAASLWSTYVRYPDIRDEYDVSRNKSHAYTELRMLQRAALVTQHKRVFISQSGKVGLASKFSQDGDKICILHGSRAPVVLRDNGDNTYGSFGFCFLESAMLGEAVTWEEADADVLELR